MVASTKQESTGDEKEEPEPTDEKEEPEPTDEKEAVSVHILYV